MPKAHISEQSWGRKVWFRCPGCEGNHMIDSRTDGKQPSWDFNGDAERPTFSPSILVTCNFPESVPEGVRRVPDVCHSFVRDGQIQYLSDCTHALAGQTVDIPDWD
jgi:hypothetical protein